MLLQVAEDDHINQTTGTAWQRREETVSTRNSHAKQWHNPYQAPGRTWQAVVGGGTAHVGIVRVLSLIGEHEISGGTQAGEVERVRRGQVGRRVLVLALISWVTVRVRTGARRCYDCQYGRDGQESLDHDCCKPT